MWVQPGNPAQFACVVLCCVAAQPCKKTGSWDTPSPAPSSDLPCALPARSKERWLYFSLLFLAAAAAPAMPWLGEAGTQDGGLKAARSLRAGGNACAVLSLLHPGVQSLGRDLPMRWSEGGLDKRVK